MNIPHLWRAASVGHWVSWAKTHGILEGGVNFNEDSQPVTALQFVQAGEGYLASLNLYFLNVLLFFFHYKLRTFSMAFSG